MASFIVNFSIDIPVSGYDIRDKIDAYYAAQREFNSFNVNEFDKKITEISEEKYKELRGVIDKLHQVQK